MTAQVCIDACCGHDSEAAPSMDLLRHQDVERLNTLFLDSCMQAPALIALLGGPDHVYQFVKLDC